MNLLRSGRPLSPIRGKHGFTLVEILTVLIIVMVSLGVFKSVFLNNWTAFQERMTRANLRQTANEILVMMTDSGRAASRIEVNSQSDGTVTTTMFDDDGNLTVTYLLTAAGGFFYQQNGLSQVEVTDRMDAGNSTIEMDSRGLKVELALQDQVFLRTIHVKAGTEVFPRN